MTRQVNLRELKQPGSYPSLEEKLVLELATEYQRAEDPDYAVVSWANQEKAMAYCNTNGFVATLDHMLQLRETNDG